MVFLFLNCNVKYTGDSHKQLFDLNWKFSLDSNYSASQVDYNDKNWYSFDLPYDFSKDEMFFIPDKEANNDSVTSVFVWYRKHFEIPQNWLGKDIILVFEGISDPNEMFINGAKIDNRNIDNNLVHTKLTPYINFEGMNVIAIRIAIPKNEETGWQNPKGIFKHVWLEVKDVPVLKTRQIFK